MKRSILILFIIFIIAVVAVGGYFSYNNYSAPKSQIPAADDWKTYKTTIRRIEGSTGYDFLYSVSKQIQDVIENKK